MLPDEQSGQNPWIGGIRQDASHLCYGDCSSEYVQGWRDNEQRWFTTVDEGLLYFYVRAAVTTLFDDLLVHVFGNHRAEHLPLRVMPVGTEPPQEFQTLVDREYSKIAELLMPGRRARAESEARIRSLLAMEAQVNPDAAVSDADVRRVVKGIQSGKSRGAVCDPRRRRT